MSAQVTPVPPSTVDPRLRPQLPCLRTPFASWFRSARSSSFLQTLWGHTKSNTETRSAVKAKGLSYLLRSSQDFPSKNQRTITADNQREEGTNRGNHKLNSSVSKIRLPPLLQVRLEPNVTKATIFTRSGWRGKNS